MQDKDWFDIFKYLWGLIVPWNLYLHKKLDDASKDTVRRDEFQNVINSMRNEIREGREAITNRLDNLISGLIDRERRGP